MDIPDLLCAFITLILAVIHALIRKYVWTKAPAVSQMMLMSLSSKGREHLCLVISVSKPRTEVRLLG